MKFNHQSKSVWTLVLCGLGLAFGVAYTQNPLYTANQNSYFLHGLKGGA